MAVKRTTIELDRDLVEEAQTLTGTSLRATVEYALRRLVDEGTAASADRRDRIADHIAHAGTHIDVDALLSDEAWR